MITSFDESMALRRVNDQVDWVAPTLKVRPVKVPGNNSVGVLEQVAGDTLAIWLPEVIVPVVTAIVHD